MNLFFIECTFPIQGRKWNGFIERDCDRMNLRNTVQDIIDVAQEFTRPARIVIDPRPVPDEVPATLPTVPGWKPETSFEDMVRALCLSPA